MDAIVGAVSLPPLSDEFKHGAIQWCLKEVFRQGGGYNLAPEPSQGGHRTSSEIKLYEHRQHHVRGVQYDEYVLTVATIHPNTIASVSRHSGVPLRFLKWPLVYVQVSGAPAMWDTEVYAHWSLHISHIPALVGHLASDENWKRWHHEQRGSVLREVV